MKYLDSGSRHPAQALGYWFEHALHDGDVTEVRWQSGFFTADALGYLAPTLSRIREEAGIVVALVGSNNGDTLRTDMERLAGLLGIPRPGARLGVVSFGGSFFHPKTYHLTRRDGSAAAYVGSANLTAAGVNSLHVEAGIVLDTRVGDQPEILEAIKANVDAWFDDRERVGLTIIEGNNTILQLAIEGVLAEHPTPRAQNERGAGNLDTVPRRPRLRPLVRVPAWDEATDVPEEDEIDSRVDVSELDDAEERVRTAAVAIEWDLVWRSRGLSERDLNVPAGDNTNVTGSIGLKKGDWSEEIDHRHYFRDEVFASLPWSPDPRRPTRQVATALFEVWIEGALAGEPALTISHNTNTASRTYEQHNEMTHLRWGEAKTWVAKRALLGAVLRLYRERNFNGVPRFRISIDRS